MDNKVACVFFSVSNDDLDNYIEDDFFGPNALNSFKEWHPDIDTHFIDDNNFKEYLSQLSITEYFDNLGVVRIHIIKELMKLKGYTKVIMLGIDTLTCSRLDEFLDNNTTDMICSSGPQYQIGTEYWQAPIEQFSTHDGHSYQDVAFINADVTCFNNLKSVEVLYDVSIKYWTDHAEQGGMNYCYSNQKELGISVKIVDYPYLSAQSLYNVRSKGIAAGGYQMIGGKVLNGRKGAVVSDVYPTSEYYVEDDKLYTKDHKQIKVFHYAEGLGVRSDEDEQTYDEAVHEMKTMWFNRNTLDFLTQKCKCNF